VFDDLLRRLASSVHCLTGRPLLTGHFSSAKREEAVIERLSKISHSKRKEKKRRRRGEEEEEAEKQPNHVLPPT